MVPRLTAGTAKILAEAACAQKAIALIIKDVSWLWRTAYNCAVQGCAEWEGSEVRISQLFEVARDVSYRVRLVAEQVLTSFILAPHHVLRVLAG
jgi:hypothetical protein